MNTNAPTDDDLIASYLREFEEMQQEVGAHFGPYYNVLPSVQAEHVSPNYAIGARGEPPMK